MKKPFRVLIVEDLPLDAELAQREIENVLASCEFSRVDTQPDFLSSLDEFKPDVIISDYTMPSFDGLSALKLTLERTPFTPFIIVTGTMNEDIAVECMKAGATDYVIKDSIKRLGLAVKHALEEKQIRMERMKAEEGLQRSELRFRTIAEQLTDVIFIANMTGIITYVSQASIFLFGFTPNEMIGCQLKEFLAHPDSDNAAVLLNAVSGQNTDVKNLELAMRQKNNSNFYGEIDCTRFIVNGVEEGTLGLIRDITERKRNEEKITAALKEKEVLLRELYHRTKNNMQVILSILALQAAKTNDKNVHDIFKKTENHIRAMSLIHQKLYQSQNLSKINLKEYIRELAPLLLHGYQDFAGAISLMYDMQDVNVLIDTAIPCGQMLSELFSNALKHAFPNNRSGTIAIRLSVTKDSKIQLDFSDNGIGIPAGFDFRTQNSLGLKTIFAIGEQQLQGAVSFESAHGVVCHIIFSDTLYSERV